MNDAEFQALHRAVTEDPDADAPRLAFARAIAGEDPQWARFIELQIERSNRCLVTRDADYHDASWSAEGNEEVALLTEHGRRIARTIPMYTVQGRDDQFTFHRGFVMRMACNPALFLERSEYFFSLAPLRHIDFEHSVDWDFFIRELLQSPYLSRLDSIGFRNWRMKRQDYEAIASCPHLTRCLYLDLSMNEFDRADYEVLANSPSLRRMLWISTQPGPSSNPKVGRDLEPTETFDRHDNERYAYGPMPDIGRALEAKHGYIPWLHPEDKSGFRFWMRALVDNGELPKHPVGSPVSYDADGIPHYEG